MSTATRYKHVRSEVDQVCKEIGRNPEEVKLLAVSKTVDIDQVQLAIDAGATAFGENRPDELLRKQKAFPTMEWHFIGNIQSRSKEAHLAKIDAAAAALGKCQRVLFEVNVSGEESKSGFQPSEVQGIIERAQGLEHVKIEGLMTMAPRAEEELINTTFSGLARLKEELNSTFEQTGIGTRLSALSMGMTEDWPVALRYGSTIVRIGRAIFSDSFENA